MKPHARYSQCNRRGFTLIEALLLVTLLGIVGTAVGHSLTDMAKSPEQNNIGLDTETSLVDKMEYLHSLPFTTLAADISNYPSSFTDTPTIDGQTMTRTVAISYINPTTGAVTGSPTHMVQMSVTIGVKTVTSWENQP